MLYDKLRSLLFDGLTLLPDALSVNQSAALLPETTTFFAEPLAFAPGWETAERLSARKKWINAAVESMKDSDLIFLDPDNGIECSSITKTQLKGPKSTFLDDIDVYVDQEKSLLIYHHLDVRAPMLTKSPKKLCYSKNAMVTALQSLR